jgi:hypothetical protein
MVVQFSVYFRLVSLGRKKIRVCSEFWRSAGLHFSHLLADTRLRGEACVMPFGFRLLVLCCGCLAGVNSVARASSAELLPPDRQLRGIRSWGLGISPVALSGGTALSEVMYNNPAWVGVEGKASQKNILRGLFFPGLTLGANGTTRALGQAYFNGNGSTQRSIENFLKAAQNEQTPYGYFEMAPSVTILRMQWGIFARAQVQGYVWQPSLQPPSVAEAPGSGRVSNDSYFLSESVPQMSVSALVERGTALSFSVPYKNTGVNLGVTARPTWRTEYAGQVSLSEPLVEETAKNLKAKFNETRGIPIDVGMSVRLPRFSLRPTFGLKLEDAGNTYFRAANSAHRDFVQKSNLSAGLAGWIFQEKSFASQCSVSGHHLNDARLALNSVVGLGCEIHFKGQVEGDLVVDAPIVARVGYNKQGLSYGLSWDMPFAVLEVASQVAHVQGPSGFEDRSDRRYFLRVSVDANRE